METSQANPKCSNCKCYWKPDETDKKSSGLIFKTCKKCRNKKNTLCEHGKRKSRCSECGGSELCEHNKQKSQCKECNGASICEHNKFKAFCKECNGSQYCEHGKIKSRCSECSGSQLCEHGKRKDNCKECGSIYIKKLCEHGKRKNYCRDCNGASICEHDRRKDYCKECNLGLYLVNLQRGQVKRCFKLTDLSKTKQSIEYLGCSTEYFINFFTKKMDKYNENNEIKMSWDNIHLDHIKPVSKFDLTNEEELLDCCHYTNLQPLLVDDNLEKSNKWNKNNEIYWLNNIKNKNDYYEIYFP